MSRELCLKLGYSFSNAKLLKMALTHRSSDEENNERLEFLGDSIINCIMAEMLYLKFPFAQEGDLSRWRASLINRDMLGRLARELDLGSFLFLGPGELKTGGFERQSILSCAIEAVIGAIYLDGGFIVVRECVLRWYQPLLHTVSFETSHKDPKTQLQEYLQSIRFPLPIYFVDSVSGESHQQYFTVSCQIEGFQQKAIGKGTSRRRAEQEAASIMLGMIKK